MRLGRLAVAHPMCAAPRQCVALIVGDAGERLVKDVGRAVHMPGMSSYEREPKGLPSGGRFAASHRPEPSVRLAADERGPDLSGIRVRKDGDLLGTSRLAERNPAWTPAAVKKFLKDPDKEIPNPVNRTANRMRLYLTSRVEEVEATEEWGAWVQANQRRSASSGRKNPSRQRREVTGYGRTGTYTIVQP